MKLLPTITALVLCSAAAAAPISRSIDDADSSPQLTLLIHDLGFNSDEVDQSIPDEPQEDLIVTDIATDAFLSEDELARAVGTEDTSVQASEPPPVTSIAIGVTLLGAAAFIRRTRTERRRCRRRRVVHMRAIIAAR